MTAAQQVADPQLTSWVELAACRGRDTRLWFSGDRFDQAIAVAICRRCPVRARCLADAVAEEAGATVTFGIRGGLRHDARRRIFS